MPGFSGGQSLNIQQNLYNNSAPYQGDKRREYNSVSPDPMMKLPHAS